MTAAQNTDDPLSQILAVLDLPRGDAGLVSLPDCRLSVDLPQVSFYAVVAGSCQLSHQLDDGKNGETDSAVEHSIPLSIGDVVVLPLGTRHTICAAGSTGSVPFTQFLSAAKKPVELPSREIGNGQVSPADTRLLYGFFRTDLRGFRSAVQQLPSVLQVNMRRSETLRDFELLVRLINVQTKQRKPGWQNAVGDLVRLLAIQTVRATMLDASSGHDTGQSLLTPRSTSVGPAIDLIHTRPAEPWSVSTLASAADMSRSTFSERFRNTVGKPPMQYLTDVRMAKASELLRSSRLSVKQIAAMVGYESPTSFTSAFKRATGRSPAAYRRQQLLCVDATEQ